MHLHKWLQLDQGEAMCLECGVSSIGNQVAFEFPYQRVLVTGGAGFLGRCVVQRLNDLRITIFVPRKSECDLRDVGAIRALLDRDKPDLVIHLAATVGGIGANQKNPGTFFYDNLMMGAQLLHESWLHGVKKFVAVGTVCCYPKFAAVPFREDEIWNGYPEETNAPYALAKKMLLVQSQAYRQQHGFNSIFLLPANLYGPHDNFDLETSHVIPALIRKIIQAKRDGAYDFAAWGSGKASREFLYVEDCADAIIKAAALYDGGEPVNIGTGFEIRISDLAKLIQHEAGYDVAPRWETTKPDGQPRRSLDVSRARQLFGFEAKTPLNIGLRRTIEWYESTLAETVAA